MLLNVDFNILAIITVQAFINGLVIHHKNEC